jgi:hypothetical protein
MGILGWIVFGSGGLLSQGVSQGVKSALSS